MYLKPLEAPRLVVWGLPGSKHLQAFLTRPQLSLTAGMVHELDFSPEPVSPQPLKKQRASIES